MDVITLAKFFGDRLRDVDSVGIKNGGFPLTKPLAVNTLLMWLRSEWRLIICSYVTNQQTAVTMLLCCAIVQDRQYATTTTDTEVIHKHSPSWPLVQLCPFHFYTAPPHNAASEGLRWRQAVVPVSAAVVAILYARRDQRVGMTEKTKHWGQMLLLLLLQLTDW